LTSRLKVCLLSSAWLLGCAHIALSPTTADASSGWLDRLNAWRTGSALPTLSENTTWDQGDYDHSLYMVKNDQVTHYELPSLPYYTVDGDTAARNGNIEVNSTTTFTDDQAIDWWMAAPFHALGMMDPRLTSTGFGSYREVKSGWQAGFTLDTLRGNSFTGGSYPVFFPGNGSSVPLTTYNGGEFPDPLQACSGYSVPTGLPIFIQVGGNVATTASASALTANGTPLDKCTIDSNNSAVGSYLTPRGGVIIIPRQPLQVGVTYVAAVTVNGLPYTWSFGVTSNNTILPAGEPTGWTNLGGVAASDPVVVSRTATSLDVFIRGSDDALWHRAWNGTAWSGWESLGGVLGSRPAVVTTSASRIDVFIRGQEGGLWTRTWNGASWGPWQGLGGVIVGAPSAVSLNSSRLDVFITGQEGGLWQRTWNGTSWANWQGLGGILTTSPTATMTGGDRIDVFLRGSDYALWERTFSTTAGWYNFRSLGGYLPADSPGIADTPGRIDVLVRGSDNALWQTSWNGATWTGWVSHGGVMMSAPLVTSCTAGHIDVYHIGTDSAIWQLGFNGTTWAQFQRLGGQWTGDNGGACLIGTATVGLFGLDYGAEVWQETLAAS
jgi:cysteine-rich secretory family protein